jgi:hypothetical protein
VLALVQGGEDLPDGQRAGLGPEDSEDGDFERAKGGIGGGAHAGSLRCAISYCV